MPRSVQPVAIMAILIGGIAMAAPNRAMAYSCMTQFSHAEDLIKEAEELVKEDTDSRILAMIAEAKGIAQAGIISHQAASEGHTGEVGKFMHGDAVRKGKWAQDLARQALFLLTGEVPAD